MTAREVRDLRDALGITQEQLGLLLGVHSLTVSKWERGLLVPSPHHSALMDSFRRASSNAPDIGSSTVGLLIAAGVGVALYHLLKAAFGDED